MSDYSVFDMHHCMLCPRNCGADRAGGFLGFCGCTDQPEAARAALMAYEEPCLSAGAGSGAVFFTGCSLGCIFCQNAEISSARRSAAGKRRAGTPLTQERLAEIFLNLQEQGAVNINLVTPSHFVPALVPALEKAKNRGLSVPVVYNTSAYEKVEAIRALEGLVDIYLPDLKFCDSHLSKTWCGADDYFAVAGEAIGEMVRQCPEPVFSDGSHVFDEGDEETGKTMQRGVIVRHLCMPGQTEDSRRILRFLYHTWGNRIFISIMNQYTPMPQTSGDALLGRALTDGEYDEVVRYALELGIENGFLQEGGTVSESFIPAFDGTGIIR